ncbi:MAG: NnrS family protein [Gammaproteobacteria bacterium]
MIEKNPMPSSDFALFNLGFRPFFLGASVFSLFSVLLWMGVFVFQLPLQFKEINMYQWHAHEMVYGYSVAVISGFLLTAVKNWTGEQTLYGPKLCGLFLLWVVARILFLFGTSFIFIAAFFDMLFMLCLISAIAFPIVKTRQWRQIGILAKLVLLTIGNGLFYLGAAGLIDQGVFWGIYGGLLLIIALILTLGRRVIPFFIEGGVGYPVQLVNYKWIDRLSLVLLLAFFIFFVFIGNRQVSATISLALFFITTIRLFGWYTPGIWKKPLLWSLFISFIFIDIGFLLFAVSDLLNQPIMLAFHAFSYGGIGIVTLAMMSRVSLGHTGRNIQSPPAVLTLSFVLLVLGGLFRVFLPIIDMNHYVTWILLSQILWSVAYLIFVIAYARILIKPRIDGQFG